jgi:hypothetical protein
MWNNPRQFEIDIVTSLLVGLMLELTISLSSNQVLKWSTNRHITLRRCKVDIVIFSFFETRGIQISWLGINKTISILSRFGLLEGVGLSNCVGCWLGEQTESISGREYGE